MKKAIVIALIWCGGAVFLRGQNPDLLRNQLVGTWRFVSSTQRLADGTTRPDGQTGPAGAGYLIYAKSGQVCVVVGNSARPRWRSPQEPTDGEVRNAFDGLTAYAGTFQVNEVERSVVHRIEVDRVPNSVGAERKRYCTVNGNRLILRAAPPLPAGVEEWTIVWERVGE
ncbi:MAG: lipocalin-like domain-containing protein [Verrucomicrobiota bacterium]